jgi:hypothetical protein
LLAVLISDAVLNSYYGAPLLTTLMACRYLTLVAVGWIGLRIQDRPSFRTLVPASLLASTLFYVVTNIFAWLSDPGYAHTTAGLIQALTVGLPQYGATPTWMFFRNSLLSDLFFTIVFVLCMNFARQLDGSRARPALSRPA